MTKQFTVNHTSTSIFHYFVTFKLTARLLVDLAHKQCNGIIKGWLHCLTPEPTGRFLVNNELMFGST